MNKIIFCVLFLTLSVSNRSYSSEKVKGDSSGKHEHLEKEGKDHDEGKNHDESGGEHADHGNEGGSEHEGHDDKDEHAGHGEEGGKSVGKGKAIEAVDKVKGFKLSKEAIKSLDLKLQTVNGDEFTIEKSTLVASKDLKGIYRFRGGFFKFLPIDLKKEVNGKYLVKVKGVEFGDQIVIDGVGLLRITDVFSTDSSNYGHSH